MRATHAHFALWVEVLLDEESTHSHAQPLVGPVDAQVPAVAVRLDAQQHLLELVAAGAVVAVEVLRYLQHQPPQHVVPQHPAGGRVCVCVLEDCLRSALRVLYFNLFTATGVV